MANRYWVGGSTTWDATAGTKWALTSGGAGGQAVPVASDDVFFDAASGTSTVTLATVNAVCRSCNFTGFTGTLVNLGAIELQIGDGTTGNLTLGSAMTSPVAIYQITFKSTTTGNKITSNGVQFNCALIFNTAGGEWTLQDALVNTGLAGVINVTAGTFIANNFNVTAYSFTGSSATTRVITMGSGTWTVTGTGTVWNFTTVTNLTLNANTSTIVVSDTSGTDKYFVGGGKTYNNLTITGGGSGLFIFTGANTFSTLTLGAPKTINFPNSATTTITNLIAIGTASNLITITSDSAGVAGTLSQASGIVSGDYLSIKDSTASGGATFLARNSTSVSGNTGWTFVTAPIQSAMFQLFD